MNRRAFLGAFVSGAVLLPSGELRRWRYRAANGPTDSRRDRPWVVRFAETPITWRSGDIFDARTGEHIATRLPYVIARRCERSRVTGRPVRVAIFRLKDGHQFLIGGRLAT